MGICASSDQLNDQETLERAEARKRTRDLDNELNRVKQTDQLVNKLLLLGAGGSGKSTLFKQMIKIYGTGFSEAERKQYTNVIYNNVIHSVQLLIQQSPKYQGISEEFSEYAETLMRLEEGHALQPEHAELIKLLWSDPGIQKTYQNRSRFPLNDSTEYFIERIDDICALNYIPTDDDVLRSRVPTTGIVENEFVIDGSPFRMFDVGGQRSERKKWIHCFENVTAVLFVCAISAFDQNLYEDDQTNRMRESLTLFNEISNSRWFDDTAMILFLNKRDIFEEKIQRVQFSDFFPEYTGLNEYDPVVEYISNMFVSQRAQRDIPIYVHVTCATDTSNVAMIFDAVKDIVIKQGLTGAGLI